MATYVIERNEKHCRVVLRGDLTASVVPDIQPALKRELEAGADDVEFDLGSTAALDSSGIGLLIAASNSLARSKGRLRVVQVSPDIHKLLETMRLVKRLNVAVRQA